MCAVSVLIGFLSGCSKENETVKKDAIKKMAALGLKPTNEVFLKEINTEESDGIIGDFVAPGVSVNLENNDHQTALDLSDSDAMSALLKSKKGAESKDRAIIDKMGL